jgi:hypothetical protein
MVAWMVNHLCEKGNNCRVAGILAGMLPEVPESKEGH